MGTLGLQLKAHIVGFGITEAEARREVEAMAKSTEGMYLDAKDARPLSFQFGSEAIKRLR